MLLPGMAQTFQNITEYSAPKQSMNTSFGSFMHVKCQLSCILTFFFQKLKNYEKNFITDKYIRCVQSIGESMFPPIALSPLLPSFPSNKYHPLCWKYLDTEGKKGKQVTQ